MDALRGGALVAPAACLLAELAAVPSSTLPLAAAGAVSRLVALLGDDACEGPEAGARALAHMCAGGDTLRAMVVGAGGVPPLVRMACGGGEAAAAEAARCLGALGAAPAAAEAIRAAGGVDALGVLLQVRAAHPNVRAWRYAYPDACAQTGGPAAREVALAALTTIVAPPVQGV